MSETEAWEGRASTLIGVIGTPIVGSLCAMVAASLLVDCSDLDLPLEQQQCTARILSASDNAPAIVGGFIIGATIALAISGVFRLIGEREDRRIQESERARQRQSFADRWPSTGGQPTQNADEKLGRPRRVTSPTREARAKSELAAHREPPRTYSGQPKPDDHDDRDRFLDF